MSPPKSRIVNPHRPLLVFVRLTPCQHHHQHQPHPPQLHQIQPCNQRQTRSFSHTTPRTVNPLLNLSHFSAAKEAQFLSREKKIPREEFHPYLQLIRSSEVDPFAPVPGTSPPVLAALERAKAGKVDPETAYTLALSNMLAQVELARRETLQLSGAMVQMQARFRREERSALVFMVLVVGMLGVVLVKTRAVEDLKTLLVDGTTVSGKESGDGKSKRIGIGSPPRIHDEWRQSRYSFSEGLKREEPLAAAAAAVVRKKAAEGSKASPASPKLQAQAMPESRIREKGRSDMATSSLPSRDGGWTWSSLFWKQRPT